MQWINKNLPEVLAIGLMSGTSMDGIDAALVKVFGAGKRLPELLEFVTVPYPDAMRAAVQRLSEPGHGDIDALVRLNWALGYAFAEAANRVLENSNLGRERVHFVASHGQTIRHLPQEQRLAGFPARGSLQIGEPAVIAQQTGLLTLADFRVGDMALGGEGAPLVPFFDYHYFSDADETRVLINIGGIANFTYLPAGGGLQDVIAYDSGPGNMLLDALAQNYFARPFDRNGDIARTGAVHADLLQDLLQHPFLERDGPKSTGREEFGEEFVERIVRFAARQGIARADVLATATYFTAVTLADAVKKASSAPPQRVYVSGGGSHNRTLMQHLVEHLQPAPVRPFDATGLPGDAKEAVCFAALGYFALIGLPATVPRATGACRAARIGKICLPPGPFCNQED